MGTEASRRPSRTPGWVWAALAGVLTVGVLIGAGAVLLSRPAPAGGPTDPRVEMFGPREDKEGVEWGLNELVQHLANKLGPLDWNPDPANRSAIYVIRAGTPPGPKGLHIRKAGSRQEARDAAGVVADWHVRWWGAFVFKSRDEAELDAYLAALK